MKPRIGTVVLAIAFAAAGPSIEAAGTEEPALRPVSHEAWLEALAGYRGEIVVVDFWATWCLPCIERFPRMVELSDLYSDDGVAFIAFSLDDLGDEGAMARAERFVREQGGRIRHFVTAESIPKAFERLGLLGLPAVYLYGPDGALARRLTFDDPNAQFTDEDVERAIREMLGP